MEPTTALMTNRVSEPLLTFKGVWKRLCRDPRLSLRNAVADVWSNWRSPNTPPTLRHGEFWALQDIHFSIHRGEVLGIIGFNGAGKSTLMNLASRVLRPTAGTVESGSAHIQLLDPDAGLNPVQTGRENAFNRLVMSGVPRESANARMDAVAEFAGIGDAFDSPVGTYSLGMRLRLGYALVAQEQPDLFLVDEALGGGDVRFQSRFLDSIHAYLGRGGALLLCSHDLPLIQTLAPRTLLLEAGRVVAEGPSNEIVQRYLDRAGSRPSTPAPPASPHNLPGLPKSSGAHLPPNANRLEVEWTTRPEPGQPFDLLVTCHAARHEGEVILGIEISPTEFRPLGLSWAGHGPEQIVLRAGINRWRCHIAHFPILPGHYHLRLAVARKSNLAVLATRGYEDAPLNPLVVQGTPDAGHNAARASGAWIHLATHWAPIP
jgi:lipopolysaccharide transport system ATP-binding protein